MHSKSSKRNNKWKWIQAKFPKFRGLRPEKWPFFLYFVNSCLPLKKISHFSWKLVRAWNTLWSGVGESALVGSWGPGNQYNSSACDAWVLSSFINYQINSLGPSDAMGRQIWVNNGSGNGLMPDGTKPLHVTNVDLSSVRSSDIHLRTSSQEITQPSNHWNYLEN